MFDAMIVAAIALFSAITTYPLQTQEIFVGLKAFCLTFFIHLANQRRIQMMRQRKCISAMNVAHK